MADGHGQSHRATAAQMHALFAHTQVDGTNRQDPHRSPPWLLLKQCPHAFLTEDPLVMHSRKISDHAPLLSIIAPPKRKFAGTAPIPYEIAKDAFFAAKLCSGTRWFIAGG